jgi:rhodanese-related sulfurtransferase
MKRISHVFFGLVALLLSATALAQSGSPAQSGNKATGNAAQPLTNAAQPLTLEAFEKKLLQSPQPQILDVRTADEYAENHLKGAINLSVADATTFQQGVDKLDKQKPVFVYSINNGRSGQVAKQLREQGFQEVYELPGGMAHWLGAGKPVETKAGKGLSRAEFDQLLASNQLVLVDVGSKYCGGCKKLAPTVQAVEAEQASTLKVVKIELYDNRELAKQLSIESVPTLILYKGSKPIWKQSGNISKAQIEQALNKAL